MQQAIIRNKQSATSNNWNALVTGANKGIGFGISENLLATDGIVVILTARNEKKGLEAVEKLKGCGCGFAAVHRSWVRWGCMEVVCNYAMRNTQNGRNHIHYLSLSIKGSTISLSPSRGYALERCSSDEADSSLEA